MSRVAPPTRHSRRRARCGTWCQKSRDVRIPLHASFPRPTVSHRGPLFDQAANSKKDPERLLATRTPQDRRVRIGGNGLVAASGPVETAFLQHRGLALGSAGFLGSHGGRFEGHSCLRAVSPLTLPGGGSTMRPEKPGPEQPQASGARAATGPGRPSSHRCPSSPRPRAPEQPQASVARAATGARAAPGLGRPSSSRPLSMFAVLEQRWQEPPFEHPVPLDTGPRTLG
ncbi:hypothetical protein M885DRAFT_265986 [Pelagophyceae sp. CCMP2097]|nr:hypothetical protein M885DRAFT_265986 [Pelagophyceae sp. CCMP2097]